MAPLLEEAGDATTRIAPDAEVSAVGPRLTAHLSVRGAPLLWVMELGAAVNTSRGLTPSVTFLRASHTFETTTSESLPAFRVRRQGLLDDVLLALRLERDIVQGDRAFDDAFFVEGDADVSRAVLAAEPAREALLACARFGVDVRVGEGRVRLAWRTVGASHVDAEMLALAAEALVALREATLSLPLLRG